MPCLTDRHMRRPQIRRLRRQRLQICPRRLVHRQPRRRQPQRIRLLDRHLEPDLSDRLQRKHRPPGFPCRPDFFQQLVHPAKLRPRNQPSAFNRRPPPAAAPGIPHRQRPAFQRRRHRHQRTQPRRRAAVDQRHPLPRRDPDPRPTVAARTRPDHHSGQLFPRLQPRQRPLQRREEQRVVTPIARKRLFKHHLAATQQSQRGTRRAAFNKQSGGFRHAAQHPKPPPFRNPQSPGTPIPRRFPTSPGFSPCAPPPDPLSSVQITHP